jgi:hypothetical protein
MGYQGIEYLRTKLRQKQSRVNLRYNYYEMKNAVKDFNIVIPSSWTFLKAVLGWSAKAVDALADRLVFTGFGNDNFKLNEIFNMNSKDVFVDSSILSACIASCCFVYISHDENLYPRLQVIDGYDATGIIDPITNLLQEGYAVLERDQKTKKPAVEAYFTAESTQFFDLRENTVRSIDNPAPYPLLVPIIYRPDARRPFGHSRISRACMQIQQAALRTMKRSEVTAEFYSFPQKYATGMSPDNELMDKWQATISSMLQITKDEDGDHPILGQFTTQSVAPHMEQLKIYASLFAGETGLTLDDLGFVSENPSSSEAIRAAHENLRVTGRKAQRNFGVGLLNVGYLAACLRDGFPYERKQFYETTVRWCPLFEPDASQISGIGDAVNKIQQSFPDYFTEDKLHDMTGI